MGVTTFTWKQVSELTGKGKPHLVIESKVYDVTNFVQDHPGGPIILTYAGLDATDIFDAFHAKQTHELLADFYVGDLDAKEVRVPTDFVQDCRKLVEFFKEQGYFRSNKFYYLFKVAFNLGLLGLSVYTSLHAGDSLLLTALAGVFLAFFWQQCGWLAHDFMHHQVFENRRLNNAIGFVMGNVFQGFSVDWWKKKHNVHHAVPNVHGGDPDIDTLPYLAWSDHALELFADVPDESLGRFLVSNQFILFFPLLMFARITWAQQSLFHALFKPKVPSRIVEVTMLLVHWALLFYFMATTMTATQATVYFLTSQALCGLLLATAFTLNHNGMPVYTKGEAGETDHFTLQIITGRDVLPNIFSNWYTGGLNYQIEHHLFPGVSRHHFHKIAPLVKRTCEKHGVPYHQTGFVDGMAEVVSRLYNVAKAAEKIKSN